MTFTPHSCKCSTLKNTVSSVVDVRFCSYHCFGEWSKKNIPTADVPPLDRLKSYKSPTKSYSTELSEIYNS